MAIFSEWGKGCLLDKQQQDLCVQLGAKTGYSPIRKHSWILKDLHYHFALAVESGDWRSEEKVLEFKGTTTTATATTKPFVKDHKNKTAIEFGSSHVH